MRRPVWFVLTTLIAASLACSAVPAGWVNGGNGSPQGQILYQSNQDGNTELYLLDLNSRTPRRLTNNAAEDYSPTYLPARKQIGFVSDRNGTGLNLYTLGLDDQPAEQVFPENLLADYPDWSPDGSRIAVSMCAEYKSTDKNCLYELFILDPAGSKFTRLTKTDQASEWVPNWSPDGQKIAFASDRDGDSEVYVINADGSGLVQLTQNSGYDGRPRWSPDGKQLAFESDRDGDWDIYRMNADGSNPQVITVNAKASDWMEAWSPDGQWLVYVSSSDGNDEIFIIRSDGTDQRRLTNNTFKDQSPVWIP